MARRQGANQETEGRGRRVALRYALYSFAVLSLIVLALFAYGQMDAFLVSAPHFRLAEPSTATGESPGLRIEGITHADRARIAAAFTEDYGRSVYLMPLAERRRALLVIDWVKDASVSRLWPNRLAVRIEERKPVAFVQLPSTGAGSVNETALIDTDGVILAVPPRARFNLPVLTGISRAQSETMRRQRVSVAMRLLAEIGEYAGRLSEIDVTDSENVRVVQPAEGRAVMLLLGNRNFLSRLQNFLSHYPEIQRRLPNASNFDLRLDDRITALGEDGRGG